MTVTSVLLVDDHPIVLKGLRELLDGAAVHIVGAVTNGEECLKMAASTHPQLIILDLRLPDRLGPDLCRELRQVVPAAKILLLTGFDDEALLRACLAEGVAGILLKDMHELNLPTALDRVRRGELVLDPRLDFLVTRDPGRRATPGIAGITQREHDVLRLVARGMTSAEIAAELYLTVNTVRTYVQSILEKTETRSRIEALAKARQMRLI